jgi:hypothetical protein
MVAVADDNSNSANSKSSATPEQSSSSLQSNGIGASSTSSSATNPSNLPKSDLSTTDQQKKAPVVDPQAATTGSPTTSTNSTATTSGSSNTSAATQPAPQQYQANRPAGTESGNARGGGASLGVNIVTSEDGQGVMVARTQPGTPADKMGLQSRDRIITLNGQPVSSVDQFISAIRGMNPGDQIQLSIDRGGNTQNLGGRLEALRDRIAGGQGPVGNVIGRARDFVREPADMVNDSRGNRQTNYEEGISARPSSDLEARLSRLEQQMDRLTREIEQLRSSPSSSQPSIGTQPGTQPGSAGLRDSSVSFPTSTPSTTLTTPSSTTTPAGGSTTSPPAR